MEEDYAQRTSAVSSVRAILDGYPLSIGIFRELLQNSDDAGASKQVCLASVKHEKRADGSVGVSFRSSTSSNSIAVQSTTSSSTGASFTGV